ncbi:hypothetical protein DIURU_001753 [Diutina rugosa]|uniref:Transcription elongation factor n=1 Tax=Diutina rugosa TaxID=5481 RepID=A0A642UT60_DIURU|nr:uncharacterized protein DIURU_001753 [Diutina rugosa]KAA8904917.1 hypothetical protein DIURU_001753 [Diutina rugosa]
MEPKEILTIISNLEKAQDEATILKLLNILNDGVNPTEKLLRETKVGVAVNKFKSHANPKVQQLVVKMIKSWKEAVSNEKKKKKQSASPAPAKAAAAGTSAAKPASPSTNAPAAGAGSTNSKFHQGPRNPQTDGVNTTLYENTTRNASVSALYTALAIDRDDAAKDIVAVATAIESEVFKSEYSAVNDNYRNKLRSFTMNLRNKKNPELRHRLLTGAIEPAAFIKMTPKEMAPESLKKEMEEMHKKNLFDAQEAQQEHAISDRFECSKCKGRKTTYFQMQTRSADEPLTTFVTCLNCDNRWKFS